MNARRPLLPCISFVRVVALFILFNLPAISHAQQPTATITELSGAATVIMQGQETVAELNMVLTQGDSIVTPANVTALLTLSDGSQIPVAANTQLNLDLLLQTADGGRKSRLKILYGRIRALLSPGHQKNESSFEVETPNAQVGVQFSQPEIEVSYDRDTTTTIVKAFTTEISVINLITKAEVSRIPRGHQAVVRESFILVTRMMELSSIFDEVDRLAIDRNTLVPPEEGSQVTRDDILDTWYETRENDPVTSQLPEAGERPEESETGAEPVDAEVIINIQ